MAKLIKLTDDAFNGKHPNGIDQGHVEDGHVYSFPMVGGRAIIGDLRTSTVTEIVSEEEDKIIFKTQNSTYLLIK